MNQPTALESGDHRLEMIRALLRRASSHPEAIEVAIKDNEATLKGAALEKEVDQIEKVIYSVPGIRKIHNQLSLLYSTEGRTEELLLENKIDERTEWVPGSLSPWIRVLLGLSGASIAYLGTRRKDLGGILLVGFGLGAVVRAITNIDTARLFELVLHPRVSLDREIEIHAPVENVYDFWSHFENYSRFMSYVQSVKINEIQGFTWTIMGPAGIPLHWEARIREMIPCQLISWESCPGALVMNSGKITFKSISKGFKTRVTVHLTYAPPGGALGSEAIRTLGFDPRSRIDSDLLMMKTLIEKS